MSKKRNYYSAKEKVTILRKHLLEGVPVSDLCDEYGLQPRLFYQWQQTFFEQGELVFNRQPEKEVTRHAREVSQLEEKLRKKDEVLAEVMEEYVRLKKKQWGGLKRDWVCPTIRDEVVEFVGYWSKQAEVQVKQLLKWFELSPSKYYDWRQRQGQANQHNGQIPKENWLLDWEKEAIKTYAQTHLEDGYRRLAYMMLDEEVVAVSPSSVYRVLKGADLLNYRSVSPSKKGQGFDQPTEAHQHWHLDIAYLNICGTFYYLCAILDGYSRYIVHWEIRPQMTEAEVEIILQRAKEKFPEARPRLISDNGPQFIARDFKEFVRQQGLTHVRISPGYPQSNGKLERWHKTLKGECIRPKTPLSLSDARRIVDQFVRYYNEVRLHSALGYVPPLAKLTGQDELIFAERKRKLDQARRNRRNHHQQQTCLAHGQSASSEPVMTDLSTSVQCLISQSQNSISR